MAYQIVLADDELPALRFVQSIIEKYADGFQVQCVFPSGEKAYEYLQNHTVDVLITDISMQKMSGIELANQARKLQPAIHIVIISGYAEFEYAQGAIRAAVDDYILKPVSINQMKQTLTNLKIILDEERAEHAAALLPSIACNLPYDREAVARHYAHEEYRFALIHWGGTDPRHHHAPRATSLIRPVHARYFALRGWDDDEQFLIFPDVTLEQFLSDISICMAQHSSVSTWTVIYQSAPQSIMMLPGFIKQAFPMLQQKTIIGKHQILPLSPAAAIAKPLALSSAEINQLSYFCSSGKYTNVKEFFLNLAANIESNSYSQQQVWNLLQQLILHLSGSIPSIKNKYDALISNIADMFPCASSYGELLASVYAVLFDEENNSRDRKLSTRELYDFAVHYIEENYARPLSVQSVCDELGISQTYLSRLFRKYSDTTFNNCLMKQRMEASMMLLRENPQILLRDIAACVGYEDSSYFSKVFHQYTGLTPSQYVTSLK